MIVHDEPVGGSDAHMAGDAAPVSGTEPLDVEPEWGATRGDVDVPAVGPVFDLIDSLGADVDRLQGLLADRDSVAVADLPEAAVRLHTLATRVQAAHLATLGQVMAGAAIPPGSKTANAWIAHSHHLDDSRSSRVRKNAAWLAGQPATAAALAAGMITIDHVTTIRVIADATPARREAFGEFEALVLAAAALTEPRHVGRIMAAWAETVDPDTADDDADAAYERRRVHLSEVGDGWALRGWLPSVIGAELTGILNAFVDRAYRDPTDNADATGDGADAEQLPASVRRADALMDAVRAAAEAGLTPGARGRAKVTLLIPIAQLHTCTACGGHHHGPGRPCDGPGHGLYLGGPDHAGQATTAPQGDASDAAAVLAEAVADAEHLCASWAVGNGPGDGFLPSALAAWVTCNGEITRLVVDPESRPLDLGRTQRVVPSSLRTALDVRDRGCVMPGCDSPPPWCEAHHVQHWADGGETSIDNLALTCSRHHNELHLGHWHVTMVDGLPQATHIPRHQRAHHRRHHRHPQAA